MPTAFLNAGAATAGRLSTVLSPFREQIVDFRRRVEEVYTTETKDRASLLTEVRNLQQASDRINSEAENLTRALKGDIKLQGNWGELVLERVLEASGLRPDARIFSPAEPRRDGEGSSNGPMCSSVCQTTRTWWWMPKCRCLPTSRRSSAGRSEVSCGPGVKQHLPASGPTSSGSSAAGLRPAR